MTSQIILHCHTKENQCESNGDYFNFPLQKNWLGYFSVVLSSYIVFYVKMVKKTNIKTSLSFPENSLSLEFIRHLHRIPLQSKPKGIVKMR